MKYFFVLCITVIFFISCSNRITLSEYAKYGKLRDVWYETYLNDSLKLFIDFYGCYTLDTTFHKNIRITTQNKKLLAKYGINKYKFLFHYRSTCKAVGDSSTIICFIVPKEKINLDTSKFFFSSTNINRGAFFSKTIVTNNQHFLYYLSGYALEKNYLFFIHSRNKLSNNPKEDSSLMVNNIKDEIESTVSGNDYYENISERNRLYNEISNTLRDTDYLVGAKKLKSISTDTIYKYKLDNFYFDALTTKVSFLDNLNETREAYNMYDGCRSCATDYKGIAKKNIPSDKLVDAEKLVLEISKKQKMLMFNESHFDYRHRLFLYLLLDSLFQNGYRNLCLEDRVHDTIVNNLFPSKNDGFYIGEPFMASLIRKAQQIGFKIYGYDTIAYKEEREKGQASNLYKLYQKDSINKWIVFAGYAHINKFTFNDYYKSAYQHFVSLAGFTPYSINQSYFSDLINHKSTFHNDTVGYYALYGDTSRKELKQSDLYIVNNIEEHPFEKPFGRLKDNLKEYAFETNTLGKGNSFLIVYVKKERDALRNLAVPVYVGKVTGSRTHLYLPPNEYIQEMRTE